MNLGDRIRSGAKWLALGNVGRRAADFAFGVALARLLVPEDFGILVTISVFTGFASMFMSGGMGQSLIRAKHVELNEFNVVFTVQLALGIAIYALFYAAAPAIGRYFGDPLYQELIRVSAVVFMLRPFSFMRHAWLNREMVFKKRAIAGFCTGIISGTASVSMAWHGMGVWSLIFAGIIGASASNIILSFITPLKLELDFDPDVLRKHGSFGIKITINDFLSYLTRESKNLLLSKVAGAGFLGIFNKAESQARLPNELMMPATMQPVFRAMGKVQDDLDQTKYLFYRAITLLMVYTTPLYVGFWWVADVFIEVVYGPKWVDTVEPIRILVLAGFFFNIMFPCARLLDAQNRLTQEMGVLIVRLFIVIGACYVGLEWGAVGVAWAMLLSYAFNAIALYTLVYHTIPTKIGDLAKALGPGVLLNSLLFGFLAILDFVLAAMELEHPAIRLFLFAAAGASFYALMFLCIPIRSIEGEAARWRSVLFRVAKLR